MSHSIIAPSAAHIWSRCPGSVQLSLCVPDEETDESREGTAAHWLATDFINETGEQFSFDSKVGLVAPNNVVIDDEMYFGAVMYRQAVLDCYEQDDQLFMEHRFDMPRIHDKAYGTGDTVIYSPARRKLFIKDYKYGHDPVDAFENEQLIMYAVGAMDHLGLTDLDLLIDFEIVQPRAFTSDRNTKWTVNAAMIRGNVNILRAAAIEALSGDAKTKPGSHCRHCPAKTICESNRAAVGGVVDYVKSAIPNNLSPAELSFELDVLERASKLLESRKTALSTEAEAMIKAGKRIPGYGMEPRSGKRKYTVDDATIIMVGDMCGVDLKEEVKAKSPRQAELTIKKKGLDEAVIKDYITTPSAGMKLVKDDGSRLKYLLTTQEIKR